MQCHVTHCTYVADLRASLIGLTSIVSSGMKVIGAACYTNTG